MQDKSSNSKKGGNSHRKGSRGAKAMEKHGPVISFLNAMGESNLKNVLSTTDQIAEANSLCINRDGIVSVKDRDRKNARTIILGGRHISGLTQIEFTGRAPEGTSLDLIVRGLKKRGTGMHVFEGNGINRLLMVVKENGEVVIADKPYAFT